MNKADLSHLVDESRFIFVGTVVRQATPQDRLVTSPDRTVVVRVDDILQSSEVLGGLVGKEVMVVRDRPGPLEGTLLFFTNGVAYGDNVVVQEVGHQAASPEAIREVNDLVKLASARPLLERIAGADLIITGRVIASHPAGKPSIRRSEHDPDWWIARVLVQSVLKGKAGSEVDVLFANSRDIAWYKSPKLEVGMSGIFLLRHQNANVVPPEVGHSIYQAIDPLDFLPIETLREVRRALNQEGEGR